MNYVRGSLEVSADKFGTDLGPMAEYPAAAFPSLYVAGRGVIYDLATVEKVSHMEYKRYLDRVLKSVQQIDSVS